jgi:hypothetical protein
VFLPFTALGFIRAVVTLAIAAGVLVASIIALIDAARRPERAFAAETRGTKRIWLLALSGGTLFAFLCAIGLIASIVLNIIAVGPAAAYWFGIRPGLKPYGTGKQRRPDPPSW